MKLTPSQAYDLIRSNLGDGTIGLISKDAFISKVIRNSDKNPDGTPAEFSHIFSVFEKDLNNERRLFRVDSNAPGVKLNFISDLIAECDNFAFLIPKCSKETIDNALNDAFNRASKGIKYDFKNGLKELSNRRFGTSFIIKNRLDYDICSDYVRLQEIAQNMVMGGFYKLNEPFPQDTIRFMNPTTVDIITYKSISNE